MDRPKIKIEDFNYYYGAQQVVYDLSLDIAPNEILSVLGPANSGITSLLRALNRLSELNPETKTGGAIYLDGKNIFDPGVDVTDLRRRVGMVFDVPTPLPVSIFENLVYGLRVGGVRSRARLIEAAEQALLKAALWDDVKSRLDAPASSLSGGQQQRLCIARVLALKPEVILLDRPCTGLDPISTAKIEESLLELSKTYTIVLAPHNVQQAGRVSDRIAFMLSGRLIEEGPTEEIFSDPKDPRTGDYITGRFG